MHWYDMDMYGRLDPAEFSDVERECFEGYEDQLMIGRFGEFYTELIDKSRVFHMLQI